MKMEQYKLFRNILCIDLKSFYASVECAVLGLDPFTTPLIVADKSRGDGSIVLAVTPYLKSLGLPSRFRIHELPPHISVIFQKPRMSLYLEYSAKVIGVYLKFISEDDLYIYSVDEAFLDLTSYLSYYQKTDIEMAKMILDEVYKETKLFATCGIGPNMLISKLALDIESKKAKDFIAKWTYEDIPKKLWPLSPLTEMWGIGQQMEKRLGRLGIHKVGDIASYDVLTLKKLFGIKGEELYYHAHGIDKSLIQDKLTFKSSGKSYGSGQTLFHDYYVPDIFQVMLEMIDDITRRLRMSGRIARTIHLGIGYSKAVGGGFSRQFTLDEPTSSPSIVYQTCLNLFYNYYEDEPIRRIHVSVGNLMKKTVHQFSLFDDERMLEKEYQFQSTIDQIKQKFGRNSVNRASSEFESSTIKARNKMIGGHHA
jgi:DNA polymerase V